MLSVVKLPKQNNKDIKMKYQVFAAVIPLTILPSACTTVEPADKDIGSRDAPCKSAGSNQMAQQFEE